MWWLSLSVHPPSIPQLSCAFFDLQFYPTSNQPLSCTTVRRFLCAVMCGWKNLLNGSKTFHNTVTHITCASISISNWFLIFNWMLWFRNLKSIWVTLKIEIVDYPKSQFRQKKLCFLQFCFQLSVPRLDCCGFESVNQSGSLLKLQRSFCVWVYFHYYYYFKSGVGKCWSWMFEEWSFCLFTKTITRVSICILVQSWRGVFLNRSPYKLCSYFL